MFPTGLPWSSCAPDPNHLDMRLKILILAVLVLAVPNAASGQRTIDYDSVVVPQNRIDARDLGYPPIDVIPNGESAITVLQVAPNGNLYGATSGKRSHLFVLNPRHGYVQPLGFLTGATSVNQALVVSSTGEVFIGASPNGHLLKYIPKDEERQPIHIQEPCPTADMGQPIQGEEISALAIDRESNVIYGLTSPNAHFFKYEITAGTFSDLGVVAHRAAEGEKFETRKTMSRPLVLDSKGNVYASGEDAFLYKFDRAGQILTRLPLRVPAIPGREGWTRVDAFLLTGSGLIYGGTSDGYLFRFDPEKPSTENLGKPLIQYRIGALVEGPDGRIYGVGGDAEDMVRLFSYTPATGAYEILGFVDVNRRPYYTWQAYVIQSMAVGPDGVIYLGEAERTSRLYLFYPALK